MRKWPVILLGCVILAACQPSRIAPSKNHFLRPTEPPVVISGGPDIVPKRNGVEGNGAAERVPESEVYTITVTDMSVRDLLFTLAQEANYNIDVYPGISGRVTLSAIDQTLPQILNRVANQVGIRYEIDGQNIIVSPDRPYLKVYRIDYVNVSRKSLSTNKVSTHLSTQVSTADTDVALMGTGGDAEPNQSQTVLSYEVSNDFWKNLEINIEAILGVNVEKNDTIIRAALDLDDPMLGGAPQTIGAAPAGFGPGTPAFGGGPAVSLADEGGVVTMNPEAGVVTIVATAKQHERIQKYLDSVMDSVHRQVLIESTVVEVELNEAFQKGVDWAQLYSRALGLAASGVMGGAGNFIDNLANRNVLTQSTTAANGITTPGNFVGGTGSVMTIPQSLSNYFSLTAGTAGKNGAVLATIKALESFGTTKVLSSPKIMALNNQPAVLKVVRNQVFFTLKSGSSTSSSSTGTTGEAVVASQPIYDTQIHTVPEGLVMTVTPQVSEDGIVSLNVRPTISKISEWVNDPNPALAPLNIQTGIRSQIVNRIPVMEIKEMETMMRVHSGQVAIMGGLMQDSMSKGESNVPMLSKLPGVGHLFQNEARATKKTELVVFLRPVVISHGKPRGGGMVAGHRHLAKATGKAVEPRKRITNKKPGAAKPTIGVQPPVPAETLPGEGPIPDQGPTIDQPPAEPATKGLNPGAYLDFTHPGGPSAPAPRSAAVSAPVPPGAGLVAPTPAVPAAPPAPVRAPPSSRQVLAPPMAPRAALRPDTGATGGKGGYFIDLGSFQQTMHADDVNARVAAIGLPTYREQALVSGKSFLRVRSGPFGNREEAVAALDRIASRTGIHHASIAAF